VQIFDILGPHSHIPVAIEVKFCTAKRTHVPVGPAKFDVNRYNDSPLRGENPDFWPVSKSNTGSLPLRGFLPVTSHYMLFLFGKWSISSQPALRTHSFPYTEIDIESLPHFTVGYAQCGLRHPGVL